MPTASTVLVRFLRITGKILVAFILTIYQLLVKLYHVGIRGESDEFVTSPSNVRKTKITPNLALREVRATGDEEESDTNTVKPLVIFFPWINAPRRAVSRYCEVYHQRGWDVLTVQGRKLHFMWPPRAAAVAQELVTYVTHNEAHMKRPLVVHASSIGAYMYTVFIMEMQKRPKAFEKLKTRICGQVLDSIVIGGLNQMGTGLANAVTSNSLAKGLITSSFRLYVRLTRQYTMDFYERSVQTFHENPVGKPALFFYSLDDVLSDHKAIEHLIQQWRSTSHEEVLVKSWEASPHAGHLRAHAQEYLETLNAFVETITLQQVTKSVG